MVLGKYEWRSFTDFGDEATRVSLGLAKLGLKSKSKIAFFAETRAEWISKLDPLRSEEILKDNEAVSVPGGVTGPGC